MALINSNSMQPLPVLPGNVMKQHYSYVEQCLDDKSGYFKMAFTGFMRLNSNTPLIQSNPSPTGFISGNNDGIPSLRPRQSIDPDKPFLIPAGFTINYFGFRFPPQRMDGSFPYWLSANDTINGTAGELLGLNLNTSPTLAGYSSGTIQASSGALYTVPSGGNIPPNAFGAKARPAGTADSAPGSSTVWTTTTQDTYVYVLVNNAANSAPGNGIILSSKAKDALCIVDIRGTYDAFPLTMEQVGIPADPKTY